jgi:glutamyl-tRNA reductase
MHLTTVGISHKTASIRLRERIAFVNSSLPDALSDAYEHHALGNLVVLSTCNRTEIISYGHDSDALLLWLSNNRGISLDVLQQHCYILHEKEALRHLIQVACGMDSMMFGESEIFGQMKQAYRIAQDCGMVGAPIQHIFEQVFKITKLVRTHTDIHKNPISVHSGSLHLLEESLDDLQKANIVLIGTSDMIRMIASRLVERGAPNIHVLNRTHSNAHALAEQFGLNAAPLKDLKQYLAGADAVVSCTGSAQLVIVRPIVEEVMVHRKNRPLVLIDLAVPCDIDHAVGKIPKVRYYDIDALQQIADSSRALRKKAEAAADTLIDQHLMEYQGQSHIAQNAEWISRYRKKSESLRDEELRKSLKRLEQKEEPGQVLKDFAHALTRKLMHEPTVALRKKLKDSGS